MNSRRSPLLLLLATLAVSTATAQLRPNSAAPSERVEGVPGRVLVKVSREVYTRETQSGGVRAEVFGEAAARFGITSVRGWINPRLLQRATPIFKREESVEYPTESLARILEVRYNSGNDPWTVVEALEKMGGVVEYAEPVYPRRLNYTPNDPHATPQTQWYLAWIGAFEAWDVQRGDSSLTIAIIDSGLDPTHPDLADALWTNPGESGNGKDTNHIDDDGNGYIDDVHGWDFYGSGADGQDNDPTDHYGHGTHSAGCAAGIGNNGQGIAGVAWGARLMPIKVTDDSPSGPDLRNEMQGVFYAATMGARVINMSFGGPGASRAEQEILNVVRRLYDPVLVAAAGNDDYGVDRLLYPASYDGMLSVAATNRQDGEASFTNYNSRVDLSAPGVDIWSTDLWNRSRYSYDNGTSFASPITAGAAALVRLKHPTWSAARVREVLRATSFDNRSLLPDALRYKMGAGRLNLSAALEVGDAMPSARVLSFAVDEAVNDSVYLPGEELRIRAKVSNLLAPAQDVTVTIAPSGGNSVSFDKNVFVAGAMAGGEERVTADTVFGFTVPATAKPDEVLTFLVTVTASDGTNFRLNTETLELPVARSWGTTGTNDVRLTFTSAGGVGFLGIGSSARQGDGFAFVPRNDSVQGLPPFNILYHGGLMIGTDANHLSAAVRRGSTGLGVDTGFALRARYTLLTAPDSSLQTGTARFDDLNRSLEKRVGVDVTMTTEERRTPPAANSFVLVRYKIRNVSGRTLQNLHCGLFLDWDIGFDAGYDTSGYDPVRRLAWQRSSRLPKDIVAGAALLSKQEPRYSAVDHYIDRITPTFDDTTRWRLLSTPLAPTTANTDLGMVVGAGNITLAPDEETTVVFAIGAARSQGALEAGVDALQQTIGVPSSPTHLPAPSLSVLPNPVVERATVRFTQSAPGDVSLAVYNAEGVRVALPLDGVRLEAGEHEVAWGNSSLPAGVYLLQLRSGERSTQQLVVIER